MKLVFDEGTLVLGEAPDLDLGELPGVVWDPRVALHRAPARFHAPVREALGARGIPFVDEVRPAPSAPTGPWCEIALRPYQRAALVSWQLARGRGVAVLPTGAGKTRVALAAMAELRLPALCLVPTRALLRQWLAELARVYQGRVGCLGDGEHVLSNVTVATFESAYRHMPKIGKSFDLLIVDEVHHFGNGIRDDALEMCVAAQRLGLTATPPEDPAAARLEALVGPTVYQLSVGDLAGRYLAELDRVVLRLPLDAEESARYAADLKTFREFFRAFRRHNPRATWRDFSAHAAQSPEGRIALGAWRRSRKLLGFTRAKRSALCELLARHAASHLLVFTADNEAAYAIAREHLIMPITCDISRSERNDALDAFRRGELRALVSSRVLNEGIDVPDAEVAIIVGATSGEREYVQRVGRLLRPRPDKRALIYELISVGTTEARHAAERKRSLALQNAAAGRR